MKLQLSYEIVFGYVQKLQTAHLIPLLTILLVITNFPSPEDVESLGTLPILEDGRFFSDWSRC